MPLYNKYLSDLQYYSNNGNTPEDANWGSYQYVSLEDVVNNFMLMYQGDHELMNNLNRYKVLFYTKRAIQELNYDAMKEVKVLEQKVGPNLKFVLPSDYVNWVKISLYKDGLILPLTENIQINSAVEYVQDNNFKVVVDQNGVVIEAQNSTLDFDRLNNIQKSIYLNPSSPYHNMWGWEYGGNWYFDYAAGSRYGLNTETANQNPTFKIDKKAGVINFTNQMANESCILEYISDGMEYTSVATPAPGKPVAVRDDAAISVNKMFENYIYSFIKYSILSNKLGVQEYIVARAKKEMTALLRNAKIRISNIHPGRLLMNMRGQDKMIK
jgi:hypothetical protein